MIYGDTDSIMIYSGLDDIAKAKAIAGKVIQEVGFGNVGCLDCWEHYIICGFFGPSCAQSISPC